MPEKGGDALRASAVGARDVNPGRKRWVGLRKKTEPRRGDTFSKIQRLDRPQQKEI